ncbi:MAG: DUF2442 domain-containing protein [Bacteroidetes bacterium]|nr:MAG: DUF2442 domain-containing protein [Bacteroidota bacterium]
MNTLVNKTDTRIKSVDFKDESIVVGLMDGRIISVPLIFYPRLFNASIKQRKNWKISGGGFGIHWPDIDEDLNSEGLLLGSPAPTAKQFSLV